MNLTDGEELQHIITHAPIGICILDADTFVAEMLNDKFLEIAGKPREAILNKWYWEPFAEVRSYYEAALIGVKETGEAYYADEVEMALIRHGREETIYVKFVYAPVKDGTGKVTKLAVWVLENTRQVSERQKIQAARLAMQAERDRLHEFFMQAPAGICVLNGPEMTFELVNPRYQELFPGRKLLGKPLFEAVPEVRDAPIWDVLQKVYHTGKTFEGNDLLIPLARTPDGPVENRYFNFIYQARTDINGNIDGILVFVYEVTENIVGRLELKQAQNILQLAVDASGIGIWTVDLTTGIMTLTPRTRAIHGIPTDTHLTLEKASEMIVEEFREKVMSSINEAIVNKCDFIEEYWLQPMDGSPRRWLKSNGRAYYDISGKPLYVTGAIFDFTEQKADDTRKNDFIGMVSHELKTPLTSLNAIIQVLNLKLKSHEDSFVPGAVAKANTQVKKMTGMINGFLNISRLESGKIAIEKRRFDLEELISEIIEETKVTNPSHNVAFDKSGSALINADHDKIASVITNLISNAIKYSPKGQMLTIRCEVKAGNVQVSVKDKGIGIAPDDMKNIFDRYYRVIQKDTQHISGFGIGLYLSAEIIVHHNGKIWAESEPGKGSTFYFSLPLD
ncbi:ATP-binding protein [Mucilaginibacter sp.]|uniref:ATP-binding protein n=1 Tax=Mucilaginibacter sp. TaxID=1882438 RepID=UPI0035BC7099